jgi:hypothetical protein
MRLSAILVAAYLLASTCYGEDEPKSVSISLDQIWAYNMPGTHAMSTTRVGNPPKYNSQEGQLLSDIRRSLKPEPSIGQPNLGFAVLGEGMEALKQAHAVLVGDKTPQKRFLSDNEITVVFFSRLSGSYVHLRQVQRKNLNVDIYYSVVPHESREATEHFALVPFGRLPVGTYHVNIVQINGQVTPKEIAKNIVCQPFSFQVTDQH